MPFCIIWQTFIKFWHIHPW